MMLFASSRAGLAVAVALTMPAIALAAGPLPQGGQFVAGSGVMYRNATSLGIVQGTDRAVIDWKSFSIGAGNSVSFQNARATLNRITGEDPSLILGSLTSSGDLYVINPHGMVIGSSGVIVTAGRFVASTLDTDNATFMNGGPLTFSSPLGSANGAIVNGGHITSTFGDVILLANNEVDNVGTIGASNGTTELAAGQRILLQDSAGSRQVFVQKGSAGTVVNRGDIEAAQISLQAADGNVYALAGNHAVLRATGADIRDGHVWLVADTGRVWMDGTIDARDADGSGGTVDTQAARLRIAGGPTVKANVWNITLPMYAIDAVDAQMLQANLNGGTSIGIRTTGVGGATGDVDIGFGMHWSSAASLTIDAYRSLTIDEISKLINEGSGNLTLRADSQAIDNGGSIVNNGVVDWSRSLGTVSTYYDMNGTYVPGAMFSNALWTSPIDSGIATQISAYKLVNNLSDLNDVRADLTSNYALGGNIDAGGLGGNIFIPIGTTDTPFMGQFDGQGHTIDSLTVREVTGNAVGLFRILGAGSVVRDLNLNGNVAVSGGPSDRTANEGILAGVNNGTILRVKTSGSVVDYNAGNDSWDGGLVGVNLGTIEHSSSTASVTSGVAGGLVGVNYGTIDQSHASGEVQGVGTGPLDGPGGLVGQNLGGTISLSYATGLVRNACYGDVCTGAAGLVYENYAGAIVQSFSTGTVDATGCTPDSCGVGAGLVWRNDKDGTITQSYATGSVLASGCANNVICGAASALVGYNLGTINQSFATGQVSGGVVKSPSGPKVLSYGIAFSNSGVIGNDVYWDKDTTGTSIGVGEGIPIPAANGLIAAQMADPASFSGWDFSSAGPWEMPIASAHPILRWQMQP
ncbi:filamentous hemagglutinin N-terminal domain-containing protein [Trinickia sp. NRRL B-1857]|uniref:two-partner secretion domain-containing protein n=1 Tax=Trinickia sp. NRRL B-1857 TaxID=3162879 RepID=UPI003D272894